MRVAIFLFVVIMSWFGYLLLRLEWRVREKKKWRVKRSVLLAVALCGGAIGVWIAMKRFRLRVERPWFRLLVPVLVAWNLAGFYVIWTLL
jgi:uncharacterized membrane protein YsdA (DUF1294 family)